METNEIGLVLYTVRDRAEVDFAGTVREVAAIGYRCAQICGTFGLEATAVRDLGEELGLRFVSAHVALDDLTDRGDMAGRFDETVKYYQEVGVEALVVPWLPEDRRGSVGAWRKTAKELSDIGARLKEQGIAFLFHNHAVEFEPVGGTCGWDVLVAESDPENLGFEVDVYWAAYGGRDPMAALRAVKGRVPYFHAKDMGPDREMTEVGSGTLDFAAFAAARRELGIECFLVEHDEPTPSSIESARISFEYLRGL